MTERSPTQTKSASVPSLNSDSSGLLQRQCKTCGQHTNGGACLACDQKKHLIQRRAINSHRVGEVPPIVGEALRSPGQPLDYDVRSFMESRFHYDFSHIRVHTDAKAAQSAKRLGALSYTNGQEIVFSAAQYRPSTLAGQELLAHELAHVIQSKSPVTSDTLIGDLHGPAEVEAEQAAIAIQQGKCFEIANAATSAIHLTPDPNLPHYLQQIRNIPLVYTTEFTVERLFQILQDVNLSDRDNLQAITEIISMTFPNPVLIAFLSRLDASQTLRPTRPTARQEEALERRLSLMQVGRRGAYGQHGPGVVLPVLSQAARPLLPLAEALENTFENAGSFVRGIYEGLSQSISPQQLQQLGERLLTSSILTTAFPVVFTAGAGAGILEDAVEAVRGIVHLLGNFREVVVATLEFIGVFFAPEGEQIARRLGIELGREYARRIVALLQENIIEFTFELGRLIGPTIIYTVLAFLGIPQLIGGAIVARVLTFLRPLMQRFPRLLRLAESMAQRLAHRPHRTRVPDSRGESPSVRTDVSPPRPDRPATPSRSAMPESSRTSAPPLRERSLEELQTLARTDREAALELWERYRRMSRNELQNRARAGDSTAEAVLRQQPEPNAYVGRLQARHGPSANPAMQRTLMEDLEAMRRQSGIRRVDPAPVVTSVPVRGGTIGVARTDIPGLENRLFRGASPQAGGTPDPTFRPPTSFPAAQGHAEQNLAGEIHRSLQASLRSGRLTPAQLQGRTIFMRIEQEVCSICRATSSSGVLRQLSQQYPTLTIEVAASGTSEILRYRAGRLVGQ